MAAAQLDTSWMWHPSFTEDRIDTAGLFVHFRRDILLDSTPPESFKIRLTADTRYKLYVNCQLAAFGPVKGDRSLWFYDEVDLAPYLRVGWNRIGIHVLRFFYATPFATSFPRMPSGGVNIAPVKPGESWVSKIQSSVLWETAIDPCTVLRIDEPEDEFLHIYEKTNRASDQKWEWVPAKVLEYQNSTGVIAPWKLSPRLIPPMKSQKSQFIAIHNVQSCLPDHVWKEKLTSSSDCIEGLHLPARTIHQLDIEAPYHMTAFLRFRFRRPQAGGSTVMVTYAECYEDTPTLVPYLRQKSNRCDTRKSLLGPKDMYVLGGQADTSRLGYCENEDLDETIIPFHFRTFRFIQIRIEVGSGLVLEELEAMRVNYPLDILAGLKVEAKDGGTAERLWETSIRTLENCMHDCYEDCPFYEQLQYAMDTRSSALFTYYISGDDRLAKQAIIQLHNSFQASLGLTASRAPSHMHQIIPHFSLYWICMLADHLTFFNNEAFLRPLLSVVDAVLTFFDSRVDPLTDLVALPDELGVWHFHDWTEQWRPYGVPPATIPTGISTYSNNLYAYTLKLAAHVQLTCAGRSALAEEYMCRANRIIDAVRLRCFDGNFFTDSLAANSDPNRDRSQHNQVWAVLSGALAGKNAQQLLRRSFDSPAAESLVQTSISMSFYTLRALSMVGGGLYEELFPKFWEPWSSQLALGLTTWEEDSVSQRSDCHAWGSAPIYEYMAEVIGVQPAKPGWEAITFKPRLSLYPKIQANVPFRNHDGTSLARVSWEPTSPDTVKVSLKLIGLKSTILVRVKLPSQPEMLLNSTDELTFTVQQTQ
ncbi:Six-hairpin glycosidase-like protein [Talaromyces proteolyticus]|uniref:Six-hairpin glycosidase-like protein n=1 Tax=Talaromyces proteolyticus TaxID=1131652 RepID=A0AAD4KXC2_9EURO|nr:Six-hairpin glycosidase-like protein [Talaromyces proteolyticus]KAH8701538.1 Six-hairpin glycosidase-like protein [Talaromyces proteolyticus]